VDVLTAEIEHVDAGILAELEARGGCDVHPSSGTFAIIQAGLMQPYAAQGWQMQQH
jgi:phosphoribosylaminoimidazole carboxylase (NCAIR synthetase)